MRTKETKYYVRKYWVSVFSSEYEDDCTETFDTYQEALDKVRGMFDSLKEGDKDVWYYDDDSKERIMCYDDTLYVINLEYNFMTKQSSYQEIKEHGGISFPYWADGIYVQEIDTEISKEEFDEKSHGDECEYLTQEC